MPKVYLDVGHGGTEQSMECNGLKEKEVNLAVALKVKDIIDRAGVDVMMSRTTDQTMSIDESASKANGWGAEYVYSIHHNGFNGKWVNGVWQQGTAKGYDIIYSDYEHATLAMANAVGEEFNAIGRPKHQISTKVMNGADWYGIIRETYAPSIIIEYCYMDNIAEINDTALNTDEGITKEAVCIAKGILRFLNIPYPVDFHFRDEAKIASWALADVMWMRELGIIKGDENGYLFPKDPITKEQFAVALARLARKLGL
jgi:N-acetylmuramoyl-L-alanine amidase